MRRQAKAAVTLAVAAACWAHSATAQETNAAGGASAPTSTSAPVVAERADQLLQQMGAYLAAADQFTFSADVTFDHVLPTGQKLQFAGVEDVSVVRPNRVAVDWQSDLGERRFWYDGANVTLTDPSTPFYAVEAAPDNLDAMLDGVEAKLGFSPPLGDFLYADPYKALRAGARYGLGLGTSEVSGRECRSLAFVGDQIDWQIWIDAGPQPVPCKLLITYLTRPGKPQFVAVFTDWDFSSHIAATTFVADLQPGAQKIPFKPKQAAASQQ